MKLAHKGGKPPPIDLNLLSPSHFRISSIFLACIKCNVILGRFCMTVAVTAERGQ